MAQFPDVNWAGNYDLKDVASMFSAAYNQRKALARQDEQKFYDREQDRLKHEQDLEELAVQKKQIASQEAQLKLENQRKARADAWDDLEQRKGVSAPVQDMQGQAGPPALLPQEPVQVPGVEGGPGPVSVQPQYVEDVRIQQRTEDDEKQRRAMELASLKEQEQLRYSESLAAALARGQAGSNRPAKAPKPYTDKRTGSVVYLSDEQAKDAAGEGWLAPPPTSEMRNTSYQAGAVGPAFDLANQSLDEFEAAQKGSGQLTQFVPGTQAYLARDRYVAQAKAFLGAITARQAGEGSRLSDEDRVAYSQAAALVNTSLTLPGGVAEARKRMAQAKKLIDDVQARRAISGAGSGAGNATPPAAPAAPQAPIDLSHLRPKR